MVGGAAVQLKRSPGGEDGPGLDVSSEINKGVYPTKDVKTSVLQLQEEQFNFDGTIVVLDKTCRVGLAGCAGLATPSEINRDGATFQSRSVLREDGTASPSYLVELTNFDYDEIEELGTPHVISTALSIAEDLGAPRVAIAMPDLSFQYLPVGVKEDAEDVVKGIRNYLKSRPDTTFSEIVLLSGGIEAETYEREVSKLKPSFAETALEFLKEKPQFKSQAQSLEFEVAYEGKFSKLEVRPGTLGKREVRFTLKGGAENLENARAEIVQAMKGAPNYPAHGYRIRPFLLGGFNFWNPDPEDIVVTYTPVIKDSIRKATISSLKDQVENQKALVGELGLSLVNEKLHILACGAFRVREGFPAKLKDIGKSKDRGDLNEGTCVVTQYVVVSQYGRHYWVKPNEYGFGRIIDPGTLISVAGALHPTPPLKIHSSEMS